MKLHTIDELLLAQPPIQFEYLKRMLAIFSESPKLQAAYVRGSLARNSYDRTSDLDLVLSYEPSAFPAAIIAADSILKEHFRSLFPGWLDKIVPDFGGLGYVFLIPVEKKVLQADIYFVPSTSEHLLSRAPGIKKIYEKSEKIEPTAQTETDRFIREKKQERPTVQTLLIEAFIIGFLLNKRIYRGQTFLNFSETHLLARTLRDLFRLIFDQDYFDFGWYHLREAAQLNEKATPWLERLEDTTLTVPIHNYTSLLKALRFAKDIAAYHSPALIQEFERPLSFMLSALGQRE